MVRVTLRRLGRADYIALMGFALMALGMAAYGHVPDRFYGWLLGFGCGLVVAVCVLRRPEPEAEPAAPTIGLPNDQ
jgi:hypothetical protein